MSEVSESGVVGRPRLRRGLMVGAFCVLLFCVLGEVGSRVFWSMRGVPVWTAPRDVYLSFYPAVGAVQRRMSEATEPCFDVLLLGGSVLDNDFGNIEHLLLERLSRATESCVRVHNVSEPAHTTLDSRYKYKHLGEERFDLVVVYHGLNEVRANNCPAERFRDDYSHMSWYSLVNDFESRDASRWWILPDTLNWLLFKVVQRVGLGGFLPMHEPEPGLVAYGCTVKTAEAFRANIEAIVAMAAARGEPVLLSTYAYYIPDDYSRKRLEDRQLDYTAHLFPVELWGRPDCVTKGLEAHNAVLRESAASDPGVLFVDQEALIADDGRYFNDICHLTHEGCALFVENMLGVILERVTEVPPGRSGG